ncbi:pentatricopeptide repeat-containing protein At5g08305 [Malania oleifera]|uniref:pentatricopeptide repeat-containing protein At5g08305 n=1 Tax=Malania oleifera TaxID=397392 RepID=UPI0025AE36D7|nr:pentatricopeptide repeat-containing protein At5g08305 [Malania oleifera]
MSNVLPLVGNANLTRTLITLLDSCKSMFELRQIHAPVITFGLFQNDSFASRILSFAATSDSGDMDYSCRVFLQLSNPTVFNWNTVIRGYSKSKKPNKAVSVFVEMLRVGFSPDHLTYPFLVKASAHLLDVRLAVAVHGHVVKSGYEFDRFVRNSLVHAYGTCGALVYACKVFDEMPNRNLVSWNAMLDAYAKFGDLSLAREVFELMPERDVVSWSSLIDGYVKDGDYREALAVFQQMQALGSKANEVTMVSVLCACAHLGALEQGRMMHHYMMENGLPLTLVLRTSLVDMYAKCGAIEEALVVFRGVSGKQSDVLIWNAVIGGLATHGLVKESLDLYTEMQIMGIIPDEITYLCLLCACAHGGLVKEAWYFFESLSKHGMTPKSEHYACLVDVLSRAGCLGQAYQFICQLPIEPTASMLGALLNGCLNRGRLDLAEIVGKKLIELEPNHDGRYIGLSNVYAVVKRWDDAKTMRETMESRGVKKSPGCSFVEISRTLHRFIAHDKTHCQSKEIYMMLNSIDRQMKLDANYELEECCLYIVGNI